MITKLIILGGFEVLVSTSRIFFEAKKESCIKENSMELTSSSGTLKALKIGMEPITIITSKT